MRWISDAERSRPGREVDDDDLLLSPDVLRPVTLLASPDAAVNSRFGLISNVDLATLQARLNNARGWTTGSGEKSGCSIGSRDFARSSWVTKCAVLIYLVFVPRL